MGSSRLWRWQRLFVPSCLAAMGLLSVAAHADPCDVQTMVNPNATINGSLLQGDCTIATLGSDPTDHSFLDQYRLTLPGPGTVTMRMTSTALDSFVIATEPTLSTFFGADDDGGGGFNSLLTLSLQAGTYIIIANTFDDTNGVSQSGNYTLSLTCPGCADNVSGPLVSSVLPTSRSVQVGQTATAYTSMINASGTLGGTNCRITPTTPVAANFFYQTTNPTTNELTGTANTPVDLAAGALQTFAIGFTPTAAIAPTDVQMEYICDNTNPADIIGGLNTLLMVADTNPVPDIIALSGTTSNNGIVGTLPNAFVVAVSNVGIGGTIDVTADTGGTQLPIAVALCQTNPQTAQCINPLSPTLGTVTVNIDAGTTPTFAVFVAKATSFPLDLARNRIFVRFRDNVGGVDRGATSVAVDGSN